MSRMKPPFEEQSQPFPASDAKMKSMADHGEEAYAEPEDISGAVAVLASEDARFMTGVDLPVDEGTSASNGQPRLS